MQNFLLFKCGDQVRSPRFVISAFMVAIVQCAGFLPAEAANGDAVRLTFVENGVSSLDWQGVNFWAGGEPGITAMQSGLIDGAPKSLLGKKLSSEVDKATGRFVVDYEGATLTSTYSAKGNRVDVRVEVKNKTDQACDWVEVMVGRLHLLNRLENQPANPGGSLGVDNQRRLGARILLARGAAIALGNWNVKDPSVVNTGPTAAGLAGTPILVASPRVTARPSHPIVENRLLEPARRVIEPGQTSNFHLSWSFGPPDATTTELAPEVLKHVAQERPFKLNWPDRRPIGTLFIAQSHTGWATNPRGYIFGAREKNDVTTPEGREAFGKALLEYADRSVKILKDMDAQGVIVWDLEGQEKPHQISYVADPRVLAEVAPEMDQFADAFFKKFTDAGMKVGLTLRPTRFVKKATSKWGWTQEEVPDPVAELAERIAYAKKRWGCTIFYLDSNIFNADWLTPEQKAAMKNVPFTLPVAMMEELNRQFPDVLIIPEWSMPLDYTVTAPYASPNLRQRGTPPDVRAVYPEAFAVVMQNRTALEQNWETYAKQVQQGDSLLFLAWYDDPGNELVKLLYEEKALRLEGPPKGIVGGDIKNLLALAHTGSTREKYFVAEALGATGDPAALPALTSLLDDPSPLVRKNALLALGQLETQDATLAPRLLAIIQNPKEGMLAPFAARALGASGNIEAIHELFRAPENHRLEQTRQYGLFAVESIRGELDPEAIELTVNLLNGENRDTAEIAARVLGVKKVKQAIPQLIAALQSKDEFISLAAVRALGGIGDRQAMAPIAALFDRGYATVVVYSIRGALDEALRNISGESESKSPDQWKALSAK